jgi:hypothetical protein
MNSGLDL